MAVRCGGESLKAIRDDKLYKTHYRTFADYCRERWQMERAQAYRLIDAASVAELLSPVGDISPANERVARPLTKLLPEPEVIPKAWSEVVARAEVSSGGKPIITAKHIESIVAGECDENVCRENFTPSEAVAIGEAIEEEERKAAKERQERKPISSGKLPPQNKGKSRDKTAAQIGMSHATYTKAKAVVTAAEDEPDKYGGLPHGAPGA